jgi:hypothetical protein
MVPESPAFSWTIFLTLLVIAAGSLLMFLLLVRRWTTQRQWVSLAEWARERRFTFQSTEPGGLPKALEPLRSSNVRFRLHLCSDVVTVAQLETDPPPGNRDPNRWNVLVRRRPTQKSDVAGLRPMGAPASLLDLMGLSQFPSLAVGQRFAVMATASTAARALSDSASRTLLPADIGLLVSGDYLVLDFSTRPFDPIELDRMIAVAQQLAQMI